MCFSLLRYINGCACLLANTPETQVCFFVVVWFSPRVPRCLPSPRAFCTCFVRLSLIHYANLGPGHTCVR